eukprot:1159785-Pelagomonas_calceolata.AAC.1
MDAITCTRTEKKANKCTRITIRAHTAALVNVGRSVAILLLVQHKQVCVAAHNREACVGRGMQMRLALCCQQALEGPQQLLPRAHAQGDLRMRA